MALIGLDVVFFKTIIGTVRSRSARAALERTAQELKGRSANSSLASTKFLESADVIPLRSSSSMS